MKPRNGICWCTKYTSILLNLALTWFICSKNLRILSGIIPKFISGATCSTGIQLKVFYIFIFLTKSNSLSLLRSIWTEAHFQMICSICLINFLFEIFNDFFLNDFWCIFLQNVNKCHLQKFPSERIHVATSFMSVRKSNGYRIES